MSQPVAANAGSVAALWRYPVKSMQGEELNATEVTARGLLGDRAFALVEQTKNRVVSAKNPRRWPRLFDFRAAFVEPPRLDAPLPDVRITLPDGVAVSSDQTDRDERLSAALGEPVVLMADSPQVPTIEEYWPELEHFEKRGTVTDEAIHPSSFFDGAAIHLLTTAALDALHRAYPGGRFEVRRFRPNIVVATPPEAQGFVEEDWIGHVLAIGDEVQLDIARPCPRCVMTTLPQSDLPRDTGILRTAVDQNAGNVGVYVQVVRGGTIRRGDAVRVQPRR